MSDFSPFDVEFASTQQKYALLNFQRPDELAELTEIVAGRHEGETPVALLVGERGCGRRYLLEAAVFEARRAGVELRLATIDLDGYEVDAEPIERYAIHQLAKHRGAGESEWKALAAAMDPKVSLSTGGIDLASALSLSISVDLPLEKVLGLFQTKREAAPGPAREPAEALDRVLEALTAESRLVVHVADSLELPAPFRGRLIRAAQRNPKVVVAFSCRPLDGNQKVAPDCESMRFELPPLEIYELRQALDEHFSPHELDDEFCRLLRDISGGSPGRIAVKVRDLIADDILQQEVDGTWFLSGGMESEELSRRLAAGIQDSIDETVAELSEEERQKALAFLRTAAVCGDNVPVALAARYSGVSEDDEDDFLDRIDELFGEEGRTPLFVDWQFQHPSLPGLLVYSFRSGVYAGAILHHQSRAQRELWAGRFLQFVAEALPARTRGVARLHAYLSYMVGSTDERRGFEQELSWWVGQDDADDLREHLSALVRARRIESMTLWNVAAVTSGRWPAYRRLALLDAFGMQSEGVPAQILPVYRLGRARLLHSMGRFRDAIEDGLGGLAVVDEDSLAAAAFHEIVGAAHTNLGELEESTGHLRTALALREKRLGTEVSEADLATACGNLAEALAMGGKLDEALQASQRALELLAGAVEPDDPRIGNERLRAGEVLWAQGRGSEAREQLEKALAIFSAAAGEHDPRRALALNRLAATYRAEGNFEQVERLTGEALPLLLAVLGPRHPEYSTALVHQAEVDRHKGNWSAAREGYRRAITVLEEIGMGRHPQVGNCWMFCASAEWRLGNAAAAQDCIAKGLEVLADSGEWQRRNLRTAVLNSVGLLREMGEERAAGELEEKHAELLRQG